MPNSVNAPALEAVSAREYRFREIQALGKAHKYFIRCSAYREARTHDGVVRFGYLRKRAAVDRLVFFHYRGLNTKWKPYDTRTQKVEYDQLKHQSDVRVIEAFERIDGNA